MYGILRTYIMVLQVDITTMLEEAVQYVKFLQLQIKVIAKRKSFLFHILKDSIAYQDTYLI